MISHLGGWNYDLARRFHRSKNPKEIQQSQLKSKNLPFVLYIFADDIQIDSVLRDRLACVGRLEGDKYDINYKDLFLFYDLGIEKKTLI